jgi:hypothetical protein
MIRQKTRRYKQHHITDLELVLPSFYLSFWNAWIQPFQNDQTYIKKSKFSRENYMGSHMTAYSITFHT